MKRRHFILSTAAGTLGMIPVIQTSCTSEKNKNTTGSDNGESFMDDFSLNELSVDQLQAKMQNDELTSQSITRLYLKRIEQLDKSGPGLNSVIEINPDAVAIAGEKDAERKAGKVRGPLHGIPVLLKDNIGTADKMLTTAGSIALDWNKVKDDAYIVKRLREAGAVILGKTNLSEWANYRSSRSSSGWSSRGGQTRNPYMISRNPCGSSSGSGVAVAANLCSVAIGTETDGSIVCPSGINGIVGIKPTMGMVSRSGIIPLAFSQDIAGPMTRTVTEAAIVLGVIAGMDPDDPVTKTSEGKIHADYTQFLDKSGLKGKRIGIDPTSLKIHEAVDNLMVQSLELIKKQGAEIVEIDFLKKIQELEPSESLVLSYEFKYALNKYLTATAGKLQSLKELMDFNWQNEDKAMPFFKQELFESAEAKGDLYEQEYQDALAKLLSSRDILDDIFSKNRLDAICGPTNAPAWTTDPVNGDHYTWGFSTPAAISGFPAITVPAGFVFDLPIGLTFFSRPFTEPDLLTMAYSFEQVSGNRKSPKFLKDII